MDKRSMFFSQRNKDMIKNNIIRDCEQQLGIPFNRNHIQRLDKSLNHYMNEVWSSQSQTQMLPVLNREANIATSREFISYLNKSVAKRPTPAMTVSHVAQKNVSMSTPLNEIIDMGSAGRTINDDGPSPAPIIYQDTSRTLEDLKMERQGQQPERPAIPDFRIASDEDGPSPMDLYQMAKAAREREAAAIQQTAKEDDDEKNVFKAILGNEIVPSHGALPPPIKTKKRPIDVSPPPRIMEPFAIDQPVQPSGKQLTLLRQDDIIQYKEIEQNLFINSMDRDWTKDSVLSMNRYNFTVNFDPSATSQNQNLTPFAIKKFRNIVRIQLIKAIVSRETLDIMVSKLTALNDESLVTTNQTNVLSFPSVIVRIAEFQANNNGTNNRIDDSFGVIHYDAQWVSDPAGTAAISTQTGITTNNGFASLIPKFLTCERVFEPTPLATLQKMSIRLERPTSQALLSDISDVVNVAGIQFGVNVFTSKFLSNNSPSPYIFIQTDKWFSKFMWQVGDRVIFKGVDATLRVDATEADIATINALEEWINNEEGHLIVGIGYRDISDPINWYVNDNANKVGYANVLIIQNRFTDPTIDGSITPYNFGDELTANIALKEATGFAGSGINASHQVQLVFKVVTREYDPATKVRPDNTY